VAAMLWMLLCLCLSADTVSLIRARERDLRASGGGTETRTKTKQADNTARQTINGEKWLNRVKRGWIWNQFSIQEEYTGTEYLYIGKVRAVLCSVHND